MSMFAPRVLASILAVFAMTSASVEQQRDVGIPAAACVAATPSSSPVRPAISNRGPGDSTREQIHDEQFRQKRLIDEELLREKRLLEEKTRKQSAAIARNPETAPLDESRNEFQEL